MSILNQQSTPLPPGFFDAHSGDLANQVVIASVGNGMSAMSVVSFPPGAYIELDDPMTGTRRLALVCDTGTEFVDYIDHDAPPTPLAILSVFDPVQWGDCRALANDLLLAGDVAGYQAYSDFLLALCDTPAAGDSLTFNRAAKSAYDACAYNVDDAARAGLIATAEARARQAAISRTAANWITAGAV